MKKVFIYILLSVNFVLHSQTKENSYVIGEYDSLYSNTLGEMRKILVSVPENSSELYSKEIYPVVYLLDGEAHFHSVTGLIHQLSRANGNNILPKMIVVGIINTNRTRDLIPTYESVAPYLDSAYIITEGGGDNFTAFLKNELIPFMEAKYPTAPYRTFIGHSLGGLTVMNTFVNHRDMFDAYISIDPSLWKNDRKIMDEVKFELKKGNYFGKALYLSAANTLPAGVDTLSVQSKIDDNTIHIRTLIEFAKFIDFHPAEGLRFKWKYYSDDDHASVPLISEYDGLRFIFDYYKLPSLSDPELMDIKELKDHFKMVSDIMGYTIYPPEFPVNRTGYYFLQREKFDKAYEFFNLNLESYPESFNVYDSMGDYYQEIGDKVNAAKYFTKALEINEFRDTD